MRDPHTKGESGPAEESREDADWRFPDTESAEEKLRHLLKYAILAPSGHNTQPWLFKLQDEAVALYADRTRALAVVDPGDRELVMSCGAALFHLRVAMRHFGYEPVVHLLPEADDPDLMAIVQLGENLDPQMAPTMEDERLFMAIRERHTNRMPFEKRQIPEGEIALLQAAARKEGTRLFAFVDPEAKHTLAHLIAEGDRIQIKDPQFRRELASWIHPNRSRSQDGIPGFAHGVGDVMSYLGPFVVRTFDLGNGQAAKDRNLAEGSPLLAVLATDGDDVAAHLAAGQALGRVLLTAAAYSLQASFLNQPVEVDSLRSRVATLIGAGHPQLILRFGYGPRVRATPRRPVGDVLAQPLDYTSSKQQPHAES